MNDSTSIADQSMKRLTRYFNPPKYTPAGERHIYAGPTIAIVFGGGVDSYFDSHNMRAFTAHGHSRKLVCIGMRQPDLDNMFRRIADSGNSRCCAVEFIQYMDENMTIGWGVMPEGLYLRSSANLLTLTYPAMDETKRVEISACQRFKAAKICAPATILITDAQHSNYSREVYSNLALQYNMPIGTYVTISAEELSKMFRAVSVLYLEMMSDAPAEPDRLYIYSDIGDVMRYEQAIHMAADLGHIHSLEWINSTLISVFAMRAIRVDLLAGLKLDAVRRRLEVWIVCYEMPGGAQTAEVMQRLRISPSVCGSIIVYKQEEVSVYEIAAGGVIAAPMHDIIYNGVFGEFNLASLARLPT